MPLLPDLLRLGRPVSIDTRKPRVADAALSEGAAMLNDVSGLADAELATVAARHGAYLVLTHNGWTTGRGLDARTGLQRLVEQALAAGVEPERLILDPGLGFGKKPEQSLRLLRELPDLVEALAPLPILVGASRKGFIGHVLDLPPDDRLEGSLACAAIATFLGASILRAHDVRPTVRAARVAWAVRGAPRLTPNAAPRR
jgi:dihydropteroate synthase